MKVIKNVEFCFTGSAISVEDLERIVEEARSMDSVQIYIDQSTYNEPPYGSSTSTTISIKG